MTKLLLLLVTVIHFLEVTTGYSQPPNSGGGTDLYPACGKNGLLFYNMCSLEFYHTESSAGRFSRSAGVLRLKRARSLKVRARAIFSLVSGPLLRAGDEGDLGKHGRQIAGNGKP